MPKNTKGGKSFKRGRKTRAPKSLVFKDENTAYARVLANLGNGLCNLQIISKQGDEDQCLGHIRGKVHRLRFFKGDIVLVGFRELTKQVDEKKTLEVDINHKYFPDHVQELERRGEILRQEEAHANFDFEFDDGDDFEYGEGEEKEEKEEKDEDEEELIQSVFGSKTSSAKFTKFTKLSNINVYADTMPDYDSENDDDIDDEDKDDDVEYDKMGNTIVKPKVVRQLLTETTAAATDFSEEETNASKKSDFKKSEQKKLNAIPEGPQRKKMEKQMMRNKKAQVIDEAINFDDI